ncbi:MAG: hypothetical protein KGL75_14635 [Acidobacteriota bacterium]|nr:hypothetical protein [Acidobacteriota bacterium]
MKASLALVALLFAVSFGASAIRAQDNAPSDQGPVDPAMAMRSTAPVQMVKAADVLKMIQQKDPHIVLVDTQPATGYAAMHIPGAINYPWQMRISKFPIDLPRDKTLIFYGDCPHDNMNTVAQLAEYGYFNVKIMAGDLFEWVKNKYPTVRGNEPAPPDLSQESSKSSQHGN